jgi:hypothetical protein
MGLSLPSTLLAKNANELRRLIQLGASMSRKARTSLALSSAAVTAKVTRRSGGRPASRSQRASGSYRCHCRR